MARIDRVIEFLEQQLKKGMGGISAQQVALELGIHRSDASADLNRLFKQHIVDKLGTRPVLYQLKKEHAAPFNKAVEAEQKKAEPQDAFLGIIGFDGSIRAQIELAKAAIIYPPHGLHTLLFGESGVGKNLLAESMWNYAKGYWQEKSLGEIPFIQFSCADYAANEQLLLAQLFGYVKGAFTGANEEHEGVVDRAQGGILFLDEIHRLPPSGQELLFMLIDKGVYRRLGETNKTRQSNMMIIGATSEDVSSNLLMTFRRRIPVQITLPRISERPIHERVNIIVHFVRQEAARLGVPIWISGKALDIFANYNCPANIGELRNDVLLCCAKSYLEFSAGRVDCLKLDTGNIPERIFSLVKRHTVLDEKINNFFRDGILIQADTKLLMMTEDHLQGFHIDFYKYIDRKIAQYRQQGVAQKDMAEKVGSDLEKYFFSVAQVLRKNETSDIPASIIEEIVWETANELLKTAAEQFGRTYGRNTLLALAWHMQQFKERVASGRIIYNPNLEHIRSAHREFFALVEEYKGKISTRLEVDVSDDEIGFIVMFLIHGAEEYAKAHVGLVIVAHGRGIAYNMAEVTNNLLGTDCIKAYDIPLSRSNVQTIEDLRKVIQEADEGLGVVLLVDMGFLVTMEDTLCQKTGVQVRIIPNVTTALALEAGRRLFTTAESLDVSVKAIYDAYDEYVMTIRQRYETNELQPKEKQAQKNILLVCATGQGVANKIKEILLAEIPGIENARFIMVGAVDDIKQVVADSGNLDFIIGSINPHVDHVPFVPVSELFEHGGIDRIKELLQKKYGVENISQDLKVRKYRDTYKLLETQLNKFVKALSIEQVASCCMELVDAVSEHFFAGEMEEDCVVRTYLHAACMFDRIHAKEALQEPQWSLKIQQEREKDFKCLKQIVSVCGAKLSLQIPTGEICYFLGSLPVLDKDR
ncbi:transcriptional regulator with AAA-type ATPase domain/transcriptional regulatory protein LevR [Sporomusaceae bacterium BoRhaA]|uniref:sigma-54-dependent transcriptional regulator n=1 Tax=Pelorhabdus rhamnosifermentans TaxID=2772457 RepID=UPI001C05EE84|nr:sigma 54-interacting transcriptional regulator [Pelorhabdus rhamnosifermentans]MBU2703782.1 transcriptional regulator with AAA-type ATPase domain/transcriptional regulatory protein LevR [Pelorhabdus rhamnosifermentans]